MPFGKLLERFKSGEGYQSLMDQLQTTPLELSLRGLRGSAKAFIIANALLEKGGRHIIICPNKEEAAYLQNDLESLLENKTISFFPDSFKKPSGFEQINRSNLQLRTEAINRFYSARSDMEVLITYPEALIEKIVIPQHFKEGLVQLELGQSINLDQLFKQLIDLGFDLEEFVYEPGQFSLRGGILDIYSFASENPFRIELFGNEIETMRMFDPETQRSQRRVKQLSIIPNIQSQFSSDQKTGLLNILNKKDVVWTQSWNAIKLALSLAWQSLEAASKSLKVEEGSDLYAFFGGPVDRAFEAESDIVKHLNQAKRVELDHPDTKSEIQFEQSPQPSFNKNFDHLTQDLLQLEKDGYQCFLFSSNQRQIERFQNIFESLEVRPKYQPVPKGLKEGFIDHHLKVAVYTDHQIFNRYHKFKIRKGYSKSRALNLRAIKELSPGDFVTHIDHGVGVFSGLERIEVNGNIQESVRLIYRDNDILYVGINSLHKISKFTGKDGRQPKVNKIGSDNWKRIKSKTKGKVKDIARDLIKLYAKRKASKGFAFSPDGYLQAELEASFIYEDTPDQEKTTIDVKRDMEVEVPMDRLVCGDVGFGKTEIAIRAAFKAVVNGKQVAVLVPTTILAFQHFRTFTERMKDLPITVDYINRFKSAGQKTETITKVNRGEVDILIGTHAILNQKIKFKDLGLFIVDEEQKFGVAAKEKIRAKKANVDTLTLTATPIPRTLQFSLMGARDLSVINTPPPNRQPIETELRTFDSEVVRDAIQFEVYRGGQVFFIHNRVKDIPEIKAMLQSLLPDMDIGLAHGQMPGEELEKVMMEFINRKYDVLVCTNIVESGLDIPNANTIIINNAQNFGLSDLHQLRGRVGRSNQKAFCYLFSPPIYGLPEDARKRLQTIEQFSDLGGGFNIAMRDMDIRGAGNLLGAEQSGFISDIGLEMFRKILNEAMLELKETEFKDLFKTEDDNKPKKYSNECTIETDRELNIPMEYVKSSDERLRLYTEIDNIKNEAGVDAFLESLKDRFGPVPKQVHSIFQGLRLRWLATELGMDRIHLNKEKLRCYFVADKQSSFYESKVFAALLEFVQSAQFKCNLKEVKGRLLLVFEGVKDLAESAERIKALHSSAH